MLPVTNFEKITSYQDYSYDSKTIDLVSVHACMHSQMHTDTHVICLWLATLMLPVTTFVKMTSYQDYSYDNKKQMT